jgi:hypothetical protein
MKRISQFFTLGLMALISFTSNAESASQHASKGSRHSALASAHSTTASAQVASGVVAVPLLVVGSTASASQVVGESLIDAASGKHKIDQHDTLEITEITITVDRSPAEQMNTSQKQD